MRIYRDYKEAVSEVKRDLVEMGIRVHPKTYQDKVVEHDQGFETRELQNYIYTVTHPRPEDLQPTQPYCWQEWEERVQGIVGRPINPGVAWESRAEVWEQFLQKDKKFAYTYAERFAKNKQVERVVERIEEDRDSRQLFISVWDIDDITKLGGISRVPCTLGYLVQVRKGELNLTYLQRSCDFVTHFVNDVFFATCLQIYLSMSTDILSGTFTHWIGSLHVFMKDAKEVF